MRDEVKGFIALAAEVFDPPAPVVEIGSLQTPGQEGYADLRPLFPGKTYVGCDLVPGPGVDRVESGEALSFASGSVGTVVAADSLEHAADPHAVVREVKRVLAPDGVAIVSTPFVFPVHHEPDFQRYTPAGMAQLLADFPAVQVFALGDPHWPHSIVAVAGRPAGSAGAAEFARRAARLAERWPTRVPDEQMTAFVPVAVAIRHDAWVTRPVAIPYAHRFTCPAAGLCRIDFRVDVGAPATLRLRVHEDGADERPVAEATVVASAPWTARWLVFQFPPLGASAGRPYVARLTAEGGGVGVHVDGDERPVVEVFTYRTPTPAAPARDVAVVLSRLDELADRLQRLEAAVAPPRQWWRRVLGG